MFLKFSILFLYFILAISCMNDSPGEKTEAELKENIIIKKAFANCITWVNSRYNVKLTDSISQFAFYLYMGDNNGDWKLLRSCIKNIDHQRRPQEFCWINLEIFSELFKAHCKNKGVYVEVLAEQRREATEKKDANKNELGSLAAIVEEDEGNMSI